MIQFMRFIQHVAKSTKVSQKYSFRVHDDGSQFPFAGNLPISYFFTKEMGSLSHRLQPGIFDFVEYFFWKVKYAGIFVEAGLITFHQICNTFFHSHPPHSPQISPQFINVTTQVSQSRHLFSLSLFLSHLIPHRGK